MQSRILLIDDSSIMRTLLKKHFIKARPDWAIHEAENAEQALAILAAHECQYVCIDYNMPGMDGLELAGKIRQLYPEVILAMVTANVQKSFQEKLAANSIPFLPKPVTGETVAELIKIYERT